MLTRNQLQITQNLHILYEYYVYNEIYSEWPLSDPSRNFYGLTIKETARLIHCGMGEVTIGLGGLEPLPPQNF